MSREKHGMKMPTLSARSGSCSCKMNVVAVGARQYHSGVFATRTCRRRSYNIVCNLAERAFSQIRSRQSFNKRAPASCCICKSSLGDGSSSNPGAVTTPKAKQRQSSPRVAPIRGAVPWQWPTFRHFAGFCTCVESKALRWSKGLTLLSQAVPSAWHRGPQARAHIEQPFICFSQPGSMALLLCPQYGRVSC